LSLFSRYSASSAYRFRFCSASLVMVGFSDLWCRRFEERGEAPATRCAQGRGSLGSVEGCRWQARHLAAGAVEWRPGKRCTALPVVVAPPPSPRSDVASTPAGSCVRVRSGRAFSGTARCQWSRRAGPAQSARDGWGPEQARRNFGQCLLLAFPRNVVNKTFDGDLGLSGEGTLGPPRASLMPSWTAPSEVPAGAVEAQLPGIATYRRFLLQTQA
jgi:hypothetical protein